MQSTNLSLRTKLMAESGVDIGFSSATWTMKKEGLACLVVDSMHDLIKDCSLVWIERVLIVCSQLCLLDDIVPALLLDQMVSQLSLPILSDLRHVWPSLDERFASDQQELVDQIEAIVYLEHMT
jgi:hypothetical protein